MQRLRLLARAELAIVAVVAAVLILTQLLVVNGWLLVYRPLWFDECLTWYLASDPSAAHAMAALRGGVDTNTPALYLLLRPWGAVLGFGPGSLRWFSLVCMVLAVTAVYAVVRRFASPWLAAAAALAVWGHPVVIAQAFEARFYAPLMAAAVCLAWVMGARPSWRQRSGVAAASVLVCTLHYFGIVAWGLVVAGYLLVGRRGRWKAVWPALAGPVALAACVPFYFGQRAALSVGTWMGPLDRAMVWGFVRELAPATWTAVVVGMIVTGRMLGRPAKDLETPANAAAGALVLVPLALLLISGLLQPVMQAKYAIAFVPGAVVLAAVAVRGLRGRGGAVVCAVACLAMAGLGTWSMSKLLEVQAAVAFRWAVIDADVREHGGGRPVVVEDPLDLFPLCRADPDLTPLCVYLDFDPAAAAWRPSPKAVFGRDMAHHILRFYPGPRVAGEGEARRYSSLLYVPALERPRGVGEVFAGYGVKKISPWVLELSKEELPHE